MSRIIWVLAALIVVVVAAAYLWPVSKIPPHAFFKGQPEGRLEIIAHRGGAGLRPENTLWAFSAGEALGADILEGDVHLTADGHLILLHDATLDRTTDGVGAAIDLTLEQIRAFDAGVHFERSGETPFADLGLRVPTVEEVLTRFNGTRWNLELKEEGAAAAEALCALIKQQGAEHRILVASFHDETIAAFRTACPAVATSMSRGEVRWFLTLARIGLAKFMDTPAVALQVPEAVEGNAIVTPAIMKAARARGYHVHVWTVDDPADMDRLAHMGVDGLITNRVDLAQDMSTRQARAASSCRLSAARVAGAGAGTSGEDCARAWLDFNVRLNEIQVVGTHNSYKQAISPAELALVRAQSPELADSLDYAHMPIPEQLDLGMRHLELDLYHDPEGGRYADPLGPKLVAAMGGQVPPFDTSLLKVPGFKVFHVQDVDYRSSCLTFKTCLTQIRDWSLANRSHAPILILLNIKEAPIPVEGAVTPLAFDAAAFAAMDTEIREIFGPRHIIRPDEVRGEAATLREGAWAGYWPLLGAARGRVLFAIEAPHERTQAYRAGHPSLEDRVAFINAPRQSPAAAYITMNDPVGAASDILALVSQGHLVRTRADADTVEARTGSTERQVAAFLSGAQYISTDYPRPDPRFGDYQVALPGGAAARCNPALKGDACGTRGLE